VNESKPGSLDMGDIVAGAWDYYRRAPLSWLALTLVSTVAIFAVQWALADRLDVGQDPTDQQIRDAAPAVGITLAVLILVNLFTHLALVDAAWGVLTAKPLQVARAYGAAVRHLLPALLGSLVVGLVAGLLAATLILVPLAVFFAISWSLFIQVMLAEQTGPRRALGRSRALVKGHWWRTFGIIVAVALLAFLPGFVLGWVGTAIGQNWSTALAAALGGAISAPFVAIAQTLLYLDLLARKGNRMLEFTQGSGR